MKKVIIFPGQGYQNIEMLTSEVQEFCYKHNLGDLVDAVLKDNKKIFDTEYAQPIVVATQLVQLQKYKSKENPEAEYIYSGISLGEITALIASGAIEIKEGLEFARQRGKLCKDYSEKQLQVNIPKNGPKREFSVAKITWYEGLENCIKEFNSNRLEHEKISITNYIPADVEPSKLYVTITGESNILRENLKLFGGSREQKTATMQCPFHSEVLTDLKQSQIEGFESSISNVNSEYLPQVISTRTAISYKFGDTKKEINESLAQYLVEPIQTNRTLRYILEYYPEAEILVAMGQAFSKRLAEQYSIIGGEGEKVTFIDDAIKSFIDSEPTKKK